MSLVGTFYAKEMNPKVLCIPLRMIVWLFWVGSGAKWKGNKKMPKFLPCHRDISFSVIKKGQEDILHKCAEEYM